MPSLADLKRVWLLRSLGISTSTASEAELAAQLFNRNTPAVEQTNRLDKLFAALAGREHAPASIVMLGDSHVEGYGLDPSFDKSQAQCLVRALRAKYPTNAKGGRGFIGPQNNTATHPNWPVQISGGATITVLGYGLQNRYATLDAAGEKITLTVPAGGVSSVKIGQIKTNNGHASAGAYYKVDGGASVNFATYTASTIDYDVVTVPGPINSTVEVGWVAGSATILGFIEYNGDETKGVQVHNLGNSGTTANYWITSSNASPSWPEGLNELLTPSAVIINLGTNDARTESGNITAAQFKTNISNLINTRLRRPGLNCPIIIQMSFTPALGTTREVWANYVSAVQELMTTDPLIFVIDHSQRMPVYDDTLPYYNGAYPGHMTAAGAALSAEITASNFSIIP